jgi:hypothetical protein
MKSGHSSAFFALTLILISMFLICFKASCTGASDPVGVYESDIPIPQLLQQHAGSTILGRPTGESVTLNVIAPKGMETYVDYGTASGVYSQKTGVSQSLSGDPIEIVLNNLSPNTEYYYRVNIKQSGASNFTFGKEGSFVTQRPAGSTFTFDLQADPHMDANSDPAVFTKTLQTEAGDHPDFLVDLGDTFMTEKFAVTQEQVNRRYIEMRAYFDIIGGSAHLFLVNGNHDGEFGWIFNSSNQNNDAYWAIQARKLYYPNPFPDSFYTGSKTIDPFVGLHENYYAWTWGNALFVVLDPYTYSSNFKTTNNTWDSTIGNEQYQWLKTTLQTSNATYKFVFEHHILGEYRGMTTCSDLYESGGYNSNGTWQFNQTRPTWEQPLHQLMVKNNVTIFFQGHDHLFCQEQKDGVVYQEVPQPSALTRADNPDSTIAAQYVGQTIPSSGYLRIQVSPQNVSLEYVKVGPLDQAGIAYNYTVAPKQTQATSSLAPTATPTSQPSPSPTLPPAQTATPNANSSPT